MRWSPHEDDVLRSMYANHTRQQIADALGRTQGMVRSRCWTLGLAEKVRPWSEWEVASLIAVYSTYTVASDMQLDALATKLGRHKTNVSRKARSLGLTNIKRKKTLEPKQPRQRKYATDADLSMAISLRIKKYIATNGHPRGALGLRHSSEAKKKISAASKRMWEDTSSKFHSDEYKKAASDRMVANIASGLMNNKYSRTRGGRRSDLNNMYFRSAWEANYARYLTHMQQLGKIDAWAYEPHTFTFGSVQRGIRSYTPDFRINIGETHEWHEVKGWMDAKSKERLALMAQHFPDERLLVIDAAWFREANKSDVYTNLPGWEKGTTR